MKRILIGAEEPTVSHVRLLSYFFLLHSVLCFQVLILISDRQIPADNANLKSHDVVLLNQPDADSLLLSVYATDYIPPSQQHPSYDTLRRSRREKALKEFNERICQTESQKYLSRCLECSCDDSIEITTSDSAVQVVQSVATQAPSNTQRPAKSISTKTVKSKKQTSSATSSASATPLSSARSTADPGSIKPRVPALPLKRLNKKTM
jgi:hypothetical protein